VADFDEAFEKTEQHEGYPGWVDDPDDPGGETVAGLTRKDNPEFLGWKLVDQVKQRLGAKATAATINRELAKEPALRALVKAHYKLRYWAPLKLDDEPNRRLANTVYNFAVNAGPRPSLAALQRARGRAEQALAAGGLTDV